MQKTILYLSHGGQKYHDQTRYSVLTLLALLLEQDRNDFRIAVYTDQPGQLPAHDLVQAVRLKPEQFAALRGPLDYVHRIKLGVLLRALGELGAPLIYVDSDTRWLRIPDEPFGALSGSITPPACYLYKVEGAISASFFPQYFHVLREKRRKLMEWRLPHDPPWTMWNSGTIGIPSRSEGFMEEVLRVNDALLPHVGFRNCVEQLALSLVTACRWRSKRRGPRSSASSSPSYAPSRAGQPTALLDGAPKSGTRFTNAKSTCWRTRCAGAWQRSRVLIDRTDQERCRSCAWEGRAGRPWSGPSHRRGENAGSRN